MMWKNYFKIATRSIIKNKKISVINIIGLTVGIASSLIIFAYVNNELSYDKFHKNYDSIYRITTHLKMGDNEINLAMATPALGQQIKEEYPEVKEYARVRKNEDFKISFDDKSFNENNLFYADSTFFDVFTYKLAAGNPETVLCNPFSILLSKEKSVKYFGNENSIGKKLILNDEDEYTVTGILDEIPHNTQIYCEFLISYSTIDSKNKMEGNTSHAGFMQFQDDYVYLLIDPKSDINKVTEKMNQLVDENVPEHFKAMYNISLLPLKDIYFSKNLSGELQPVGNKRYITIFLTITVILVIIAAINFMNLSTSRYIHRVREVGMRKVFGAFRKHLILQFIGESLILTILALFIGIIAAELINPALNNFIGKELSISFFSDYKMLGFLIFITVFIGFISGSYPALFLSKFSPQDVFKLNRLNGDSGINIRRVLVILQFTIASVLVVFTIFVFSQVHFLKNTELGYNKDNVLLLTLEDPEYETRFESLKDELKAVPGIKNVSYASGIPGSGGMVMQNIPLAEGSDENLLVQRIEADADFINTLEIEMKEGRFFSDSYSSDESQAVILNETAVKKLNLENPVGKLIPLGGETKRTIIGVVKDFHFQSLRNEISATILLPKKSSKIENYVILGSLAIKIEDGMILKTMPQIENKWNNLFSDLDFNYDFLKDRYNSLYESDIKLGKLFIYFSSLIIIISCLGIYALASFSIEKRIKEISIRKILGGTLKSILLLLSKQFMVWVIISNVISIPVIYYFVDKWLKDFQYHMEIGWVQFALGYTLIIALAILTILFQTIKAARMNPAESLRYE